MQLNGRDVTLSEMSSLALHNYGHFTSMRVQSSAVPGLSLHLERLRSDCATLFDVELDLAAVRSYLRRAVAGSPKPEIVRVTVFDPHLQLGRPAAASPQILVTKRPAPSLTPPPLRLTTAPFERDLPAVKHVGLFPTIRARRTAQQHGYDDVLFVDADGRIAEGATWNIGFYDGDKILWPKAEVLPGVTMRLIERSLRERSVPSVTMPVAAGAIDAVHAAFATNVSVGVQPISAINGHEFPADAPIIATLRDAYFALPAEPI